MKKFTRIKTQRKVLQISEGLLSRLSDVLLVFLTYHYELITDPKMGRSLPYALSKMDKRMEGMNYNTLKRAVGRLRQQGLIQKDFQPTQTGKKRLEGFFPQYVPSPKWDENWYIVIFDIPENIRRKRDILRDNLRRLGFGKLQNSVWISPYNFLGDIQKIVQEYNLESYVVFSISKEVGLAEAKKVAEKVWKLSEIQERYFNFINQFRNKRNLSAHQIYFHYHSILQDDPQLPKELLPKNWLGEEAHELYLKRTKRKE